MTAALRGFNMELNATSAQRINDVYSELAAITASDTEEIATAMTKTASMQLLRIWNLKQQQHFLLR